jgi:hypothetical protein
MSFNTCSVPVGIVLAGVLSIPALGQNGATQVATGHREILLQITSSWNGKPYTHYPSGQPELHLLASG